eukprot:CAMPEP_0116916652 /NCGR_PEP_ID=MMETSP0467-20121206/18662_1 /TAXON_ID=283647 /ORGANISM="Mesodinium pulex, Strain SPMC105" /LENGTH=75 /DNA_ID=CAMNT_0004593569 /DNA_START=747 /DNA_END=977 /DNA_ORIENTATION=-
MSFENVIKETDRKFELLISQIYERKKEVILELESNFKKVNDSTEEVLSNSRDRLCILSELKTELEGLRDDSALIH